jgi:hypothetical protein
VTAFKKKAAALGHSATSPILRIFYSPECVEEEFSEVLAEFGGLEGYYRDSLVSS